MQNWESVEKMSKLYIDFFDICFDILHKLKGNLGQERVKGGPPSFQSKNWNNFLRYPWKNDSFSSFVPTFPPVPP